MSIEDQFRDWVNSLSLLDQQLLKNHARDSAPPEKVINLLKYGPLHYTGWFESDPPTYFYPEPLLRALGVERHAPLDE